MACLPNATRRFIHSTTARGLAYAAVVNQILNGKSQPDTDMVFDTYASLLKACINMRALSEGKQVHASMVINGFHKNPFLGTKLVSLYAKCGRLENARLVFDKIRKRNVFLWNSMIRGYAWNGPCREALTLFYQMQREGIEPDNFTFSVVLKACAGLSALQEGKEIHYYIIRCGFESDVSVGTALIDMYAKCGSIDVAGQLFDKMSTRNVVSWSAMIAGYAQNGQANKALALFRQMQVMDVMPNLVTIVSLLQACAHLTALLPGKSIHAYIIRSGFQFDISVENSLVAMYAQCKSMDIARQLFDKMFVRDVVSWNTIIAGYAQNGPVNEAFTLFRQMQLADVKPSAVTMLSVLPAPAHLAVLQQGKGIHAYIIQSGFESDIFVGTALIDMYAKCGSLEIARQFFEKMPERNVVSWSAMIAGYGMHGHGDNALALFSQMQHIGMRPDHITFICVLSACSHAGLVDEGWQYFDCMSQDYCIDPRVEHYACMVDLLGRAGRLHEAQNFIKNMPLEPDATVWGALLGACRVHGNTELGEYASKHLLELDPKNVGNYVLLSNIYAAAGKWNDVTGVRTTLKNRGLKKIPGCSWIEIKSRVHSFFVGDKSHPQSEQVYAMLEILAGQMKEAGYVPDMSIVLHDVEEEYVL